MGVSISQPDEQILPVPPLVYLGVQAIVFAGSVRRSDQSLSHLWCCAVCWPPPWGQSSSTSAQLLQVRRPSAPASGRVELVISASYILLEVKRVYNMSTSRQICPAEYKSADGATHQLMDQDLHSVTISIHVFTHKSKMVIKLSLPNKQHWTHHPQSQAGISWSSKNCQSLFFFPFF